ncbi:MAG: hypothetical protein M1820_002704 [Bogoriella megaspora]|nr:MAG: hypothetical protein M1820_002704 [Bogoriella megaspora]
MTTCRFWLNGNCRFGEYCRNEHPEQPRQQPPSQNSRDSRYEASQGGSGDRGGGRARTRINTSENDIRDDMVRDRPIWLFSSYSPSQDHRQLFSGSIDQSPEEARLHVYQGAASGNLDRAVQDEKDLSDQAWRQTEAVLNDLRGAMQYLKNQPDRPTNYVNNSNGTFAADGSRPRTFKNSFAAQQQNNPRVGSSAPPTGFGAPSFGQPSTSGQSLNPFARSPFAKQGSSIGRPSVLGQAPSFGQPSTVGQPSPFGQPSAFGQASSFGRPSQLGQPSTGFGQPSFGQASSGFARPSAPIQQINPFSRSVQNNQSQSPFAQVSTGGASGPNGGLGGRGAGTGFGGSFGQPSAPVGLNPFQRNGQEPAQNLGMSDTSMSVDPATPAYVNGFTQASNTVDNAGSAGTGGFVNGQTSGFTNNSNQFRNAQNGSTLFPSRAPEVARTTEAPQQVYEERGNKLQQDYQYVVDNDEFKDGVMPDVAPKVQWRGYGT